MVGRSLRMGKQISERMKSEGWGSKVIDRLAGDLRRSFPEMKGLSPRNLRYMRTFAETYQGEQFLQQAVAKLPWGHNVCILDYVRDPVEREFYVHKTIEHGWSRNVLVHQIESDLYHRQGKAIANFDRTLPAPQSELALQRGDANSDGPPAGKIAGSERQMSYTKNSKPFHMERLIALISGNVQKVSYRTRVADLARAFTLTGLVENLKDGRVKIIAEGDHDALSRFEEAICINDHLIQVSRIETEYYPAISEFNGFYFADPGDIEYDQREILEVVENVRTLVDLILDLDRKMDLLLENQEKYSAGFDAMIDRIEEKNELLDKKAEMLDLKATLKEKGIILIGLASFGSSTN